MLPPWRLLSSGRLPLRFLQPLDLPPGPPFSLHQNKIPLPQTTGPQPLLKFEFSSCRDWVRNAVRRQYQFERGFLASVL